VPKRENARLLTLAANKRQAAANTLARAEEENQIKTANEDLDDFDTHQDLSSLSYEQFDDMKKQLNSVRSQLSRMKSDKIAREIASTGALNEAHATIKALEKEQKESAKEIKVSNYVLGKTHLTINSIIEISEGIMCQCY